MRRQRLREVKIGYPSQATEDSAEPSQLPRPRTNAATWEKDWVRRFGRPETAKITGKSISTCIMWTPQFCLFLLLHRLVFRQNDQVVAEHAQVLHAGSPAQAVALDRGRFLQRPSVCQKTFHSRAQNQPRMGSAEADFGARHLNASNGGAFTSQAAPRNTVVLRDTQSTGATVATMAERCYRLYDSEGANPPFAERGGMHTL